MDIKLLHRTFAGLSFLLAAIVYLMTVQPSVPFWDCGEFSAASVWQQVPHPPGAPLFLMIGKVFQTLIPFGDLGWRVNLAAVFSSAFSVLLTYLITVRMLTSFRGRPQDLGEALAIFGSGFIAAAAMTFSDTMWFNSVESEVYATSLTFVALIIWLMMKWYEQADEQGNERWLLLIAYLIGLSTGVHLLSILTIFSIVLLVYFKKYKFSVGSFLIMGIIAIVVFFMIYPVIVKWIPAFLSGHSSGRSKAFEYAIEDSVFLKIVAIGSIIGALVGFYIGYKKKIQWVTLTTSAFLLIILGYTTYTQILLRSNANPPMNENEPKDFSKLASYLGREQYGDAPFWPRRYQTEDYFVQKYVERDSRGNYVYGEWYPPERVEARRKDGTSIGVTEFTKINGSGEINYMIKYQMNHMYWRYFGWNFIGRKSDVQDAGVAWFTTDSEVETLNHESGYKDQFPIRFFALPLLFGLIGLVFHFMKDPKMAAVYIIMFLLMGVLAALQQNQQDPQPRERDYFYAGSFLVWCLWIGMGAFSLMDSIGKRKISPAIAGSVFLGSLILVPVNMAVGGWKIHSRAGNYLPFDYSYNILQSVEPNAIMFTNGDNDTFPLWWLQDVAGVRRDVRIANLSLGNTLWYVDQLKNREPWGAKKVPLSFADDSLKVYDETDPRALSYDFGEARVIEIPVRKEILKQYTDDPQIIESGKMSFTFAGKPYREVDGKMIYLTRVQDKLILDILQQVKFERPVYFSNTVGPDAFAGLESHFRYEGMAMRICPVPQNNRSKESLEPNIMEKCLMNVDNTNDYSKEFKYGFKFRNLNNSNVYYDEVHRRLMSSYRSLYITYAAYNLQDMKNKKKAEEVLDKMNNLISYTQFPISFDALFRIAKIYEECGAKDKAYKFADLGINSSTALIKNPNISPQYLYYEATGRSIGPYNVAAILYEVKEDYIGAANILTQLLAYIDQIMASDNQNQQLMGNYYRTKADIAKYELFDYYKKNGIDAAEKYAKEKMDKYNSEQSQENQFNAMSLNQALIELRKKAGVRMPELSDTTAGILNAQ